MATAVPEMKNKRWTALFAKTHLEAWKKSTLSKREYCARENIDYSRFVWWAGRLQDTAAAAASEPIKFLPVRVQNTPQHTAAHKIEVTLKCGRSLRVADNFDPQTLSALIAVFEGQC